MSQFEEHFEHWLSSCLSGGCPSEVVAFTFNLFEQEIEGSRFGIELVGTSEFDPADSDWACSEVWEPSQGRSIAIPILFCTSDWQVCLAEMTTLIVAISTTNTRLGFILKSVEGVGIGFVDGDLNLIEFGR